MAYDWLRLPARQPAQPRLPFSLRFSYGSHELRVIQQVGRRLTLLMAERLLEIERPRAEQLLAALRARSSTTLLHVYPGADSPRLSDVARQRGLPLECSADATVALLPKAFDETRVSP